MKRRPDWDTVWMTLAFTMAQRSRDESTSHGCVIVKDNKLLAIGYNSYPEDCRDDLLPKTRPDKYKVIIHSEINAINNRIDSLAGATAYNTGFPCTNCFGSLLQNKIMKIIYGPVGSHQLSKRDIELVNLMNVSAKDSKTKIQFIKFEEVDNIFKLQGTVKDYIIDKVSRTDLVNG